MTSTNQSIEKPDRDLSKLAPFFEVKLVAALKECNENGLNIAVFEGYRSPASQNALYAQGRTAPGKKVTFAKANESWHQLSVAADCVFYKDRRWSWDGDWDPVHEIFIRHGFETLNFEKPHFQITGGFKIDEAVKIAKSQGTLALWHLIEQRIK